MGRRWAVGVGVEGGGGEGEIEGGEIEGMGVGVEMKLGQLKQKNNSGSVDNFMHSHGLFFLSPPLLCPFPPTCFHNLLRSLLLWGWALAFIVSGCGINDTWACDAGVKSGYHSGNVSNGEYLLRFIITLRARALLGFLLPFIELAYAQVQQGHQLCGSDAKSAGMEDLAESLATLLAHGWVWVWVPDSLSLSWLHLSRLGLSRV